MNKQEKQKQIDILEFKIKALVLKAKWQKLNIVETIILGMQVVALTHQVYIIASQPIPKFKKGSVSNSSGLAIIGNNDRPEIIVRK